MMRPQVADRGNGLQIWRVAANILNKQLRTADKGWSSSFGFGRCGLFAATYAKVNGQRSVLSYTGFIWLGIKTGEHGNKPSDSIKYSEFLE
jgi:hypothetical protein